MPPDSEIREIVKQVLAENAALQHQQVDAIALKAISTVLTAFGIEEKDRLEFRADLMHLRSWRKSTETVQRAGWVAIIGILASGLLGALWLGIKTALGK